MFAEDIEDSARRAERQCSDAGSAALKLGGETSAALGLVVESVRWVSPLDGDPGSGVRASLAMRLVRLDESLRIAQAVADRVVRSVSTAGEHCRQIDADELLGGGSHKLGEIVQDLTAAHEDVRVLFQIVDRSETTCRESGRFAATPDLELRPVRLAEIELQASPRATSLGASNGPAGRSTHYNVTSSCQCTAGRVRALFHRPARGERAGSSRVRD